MSKTAQQLIEEEYLLMRGILSEDHEKIVDDILALDEISKKTLGSYIKKAAQDAKISGYYGARQHADHETSNEVGNKLVTKADKRVRGVIKATDRLTKEQKELIGSILEELEAEFN